MSRGWAQWGLPIPLVMLCAGTMHSTLVLLPAAFFCFPLLRSGSWIFGFSISLSIICLNCTCTELFLVPCNFFVFCCSRRHLSRCKHEAKGARSQPYPSNKCLFPFIKHCMLRGVEKSTKHVLSHLFDLIHTVSQYGRSCFYLHYTDKETEA